MRSHPKNSIPFTAELRGSIVSERQADLTTSESLTPFLRDCFVTFC